MTTKPSSSDHRLTRTAGIRTIQIGELNVSYVPDGGVQLRPQAWLPGTTAEFWSAHSEYLDATGNLVASIGGLLVEHGDRALLIDAGFGPTSIPADPVNAHGAIHGGALLDSLAELRRAPSAIEAVAITHLHIDHIRWLWQAAGDRLPFAEAAILIAEPEWSRPDLAAAQGTAPDALAAFAPQVRTLRDGEKIFPGVHVSLMPGHTIGHATYVIASRGRRLIAFGDALHSPVQIAHPEWSAAPDHDPDESARYRHRLVEELAVPNTMGFGIPFDEDPRHTK